MQFIAAVSVLLCLALSTCTGQTPGDADSRCTVDHDRSPVYPDTVRNLMDSYHYVTLLPGNGTGNPPLEGAVWNDRSFDGNDVTNTFNPTYWQQGAGGICRFQTKVCGYRRPGTQQNNWLFTQHIRKDFDPNTYNYPVEIQVELVYGTVSCRERNGCKESFYLHKYITNSQRLPSTQGTGFMNTQNYEQFAVVSPERTSRTYTETFNFTLAPSETGFYIGIQDTGTCVGVSRVRVYRNNCRSFQSGLVLYPDGPAPVSGSVNMNVECADNAGSAQVTCGSDGRWGSENPVCQFSPGSEDRATDHVGQAPGDADARCTVDHDRSPVYPDTVRNLMDSYHYVTLLPGNGTGNPPLEGAVWNDRSYDGNDEINTVNPTYWQQGAGGICRFQTRVCGYRRDGADQNNWLFTQHIGKDFDPNTYNYPVEIQVELTYATVSCRERNGCKESFYLHKYITNSQRLPSTQGTGFMSTQNYEQFAVVSPERTSRTYTETFNFTLAPSETGFYIGIQDTGTCVGVSRLRVYRNNCRSFQSGLVLYPDAPAPVSGSVNINVECVDNAVVSGSAQVTCGSDGRWGSENPVCQCSPGSEDRTTECVARPPIPQCQCGEGYQAVCERI